MENMREFALRDSGANALSFRELLLRWACYGAARSEAGLFWVPSDFVPAETMPRYIAMIGRFISLVAATHITIG